MDRKRNLLVDKFDVVDEYGSANTISVWETIIEVRTLSGTSFVPGMKSLYDRQGQHVNCLNGLDGKDFQIVQSGIKLTRV